MPKQKSIPDKMYFRIGEVAGILNVKPYVLRYWETEFPDIKLVKSQSKQRLYKKRDVEMLVAIKRLLYEEKFTINGAREHLKGLMRAQESPQAKETDLFGAAPPADAKSKAKSAAAENTKKVLAKIKSDLKWC